MLSAAKRVASVLALSLFGLAANAQNTPSCGPTWYPGEEDQRVLRLTGTPYAIVEWDPDGPGPRGEVLAVGGGRMQARTLQIQALALFDPVTQEWSSLPMPEAFSTAGQIYSLCVLPNGDLAIGGNFSFRQGNEFFGYVAVFSTTTQSWRPARPRVTRAPFPGVLAATDMFTLQTGELVVFGNQGNNFPGQVPDPDVVIYNLATSSWTAFRNRSLITGSSDVTCGEILPNGDFLIGVGSSRDIIRLSPTSGTWSAIPVTSPGWERTFNMAIDNDGDVIVTGDGPNPLRLDPLTLVVENIGPNLQFDEADPVLVLPNNEIIVGANSRNTSDILRRDPATGTWTEVGDINAVYVAALFRMSGGDLVAVGDSLQSPDAFRNAAVRFDSATGRWLPLMKQGSIDGEISDLIRYADGSVVALGTLHTIGGVNVPRAARYDPVSNAWAGLGIQSSAFRWSEIRNGVVDAAGDLYAIGGGDGRSILARYDATADAWSEVPGTPSGSDQVIATMGSSIILASGLNTQASSRVDRFDPSTGMWSSLGQNLPLRIKTITALQDGRIVAAGYDIVGSLRAKALVYDPDTTQWSDLPGFQADGGFSATEFTASLVLQDGRLLLGGSFPTAAGVQFNNLLVFNPITNTVSPFGPAGLQAVRAIEAGENGDVLVLAEFRGASNALLSRVAKLDGQSGTWTPFATGLDAVPSTALQIDGNVLFGGEFRYTAAVPNRSFARFSPTGLPWIARQPVSPGNQCRGGSVTLTAALAGGTGDAQVLWHKDGVPLDPALNPSAATPTLELSGLTAGDAGNYTAVFTNACGSTTSEPALVNVCIADFDCSSEVDLGDLLRFFNCFDAMDPCADLNADNEVDMDDFYDFFNAYDVEC